MILLCEAAHCEHPGAYGYESGHTAGNNTGDELRTIAYYNYPWQYVYRAKDISLAQKIADLQKRACDNLHIGYSQPARQGYMTQMIKVNYDPTKITEMCDCDCSSLTNGNVFTALSLAGIKSNINGYEVTAEMPAKYASNNNFVNVTQLIDLETGAGLQPGDILFTPSKHTAVCYKIDKDVEPISYVYKGVDYSHVFDPVYYADKYEDLRKAFGYDARRLFKHFCDHGMREARRASEAFDPSYYKSAYIDLVRAFGNSMQLYYWHYEAHGIKEGRQAAVNKTGVVTTALYMREKPITGRVVAVLPKDATIEILEEVTADNNKIWYKVKYNNLTGYCSSAYVR